MTISKRLYSNNAKTNLAANITAFATSITVVDGSLFPNPGAGEYFLVTLELGPYIEIIRVNTRVGNTFTSCVRGLEGKTPYAFTAGARVENRVTSDSLTRFESVVDNLKQVASVDVLDLPINSNSSTYICLGGDSSGNPVVAIRHTDTNWRFSTHSTVALSSSATTGTTTSASFTSAIGTLHNFVNGKYILQFISGVNLGQCRRLTAVSDSSVTWSTPTPVACGPGDQFEIYVSDASILSDISNTTDNSLLASLGNRSKHGYLYFIGNF